MLQIVAASVVDQGGQPCCVSDGEAQQVENPPVLGGFPSRNSDF